MSRGTPQPRQVITLARRLYAKLTLGSSEALALDDGGGHNGKERPPSPLRISADHDRIDRSSRHGPPVFVSGCCRGGTSILAHLLSHHPQLCSVGRGQYHEASWVWNERFHDRSHHRWAIEPWLSTMRKTAEDVTPELLTFFRQTYSAACAEGRMLEKTPANAVRLPFIHGIYPDCFIIHIVRDGRHTAASLMARRVKPLFAAQQWVGAHGVALTDIARLATSRATVVRYEELTRCPVDTLLRLCRHCGLDSDPRVREILSAAVQTHVRHPRDRWSELNVADRRRVITVLEEMQARLGYPVDV